MLGRVEVVQCDGTTVETEPTRTAVDGVTAVRRTLRATRSLVDIGSGRFDQPTGGVRWTSAGREPTVEIVGFASTQFALPVTGGADLDFDFAPADGLRSPRVVTPLIARRGAETLLLAPLDSFHEQVIAVVDDQLHWGWHGDMDAVDLGFCSTVGEYRGPSMTAVLAAWRDDLAPTAERVADNPFSTHLSYWTDNGAAYWYRTEAGHSIAESVGHAVRQLRKTGVPVRSVELDSWFYSHETPREIAEIGYPDLVPPTGAMSWTPRSDAFPASAEDPIGETARSIGEAPLALHARHISPVSPYVTEGRAAGEDWWVGRVAAHPADPEFFKRWFDDARRWGAVCIEQDWMQVIWFGCRPLRSRAGRATEWLWALDRHAADTDIGVVYCMATPADLIEAHRLDNVVAARTCDDYRFADDPAFLWIWFLTVNRLVNTLGIPAFKDCFFSNPDVGPDDDAIDGDPHAEAEALLSALSGGPVGLGDRIGRTNVDIVLRTCDADGRLRAVDRAIALADDCMFGKPRRGERLAWATTTATQRDGSIITYVIALHTGVDRKAISDSFALGRPSSVYDWRRRRFERTDIVDCTLTAREWMLFVCADTADVGEGDDWLGDPSKYVTNPRVRPEPR